METQESILKPADGNSCLQTNIRCQFTIGAISFSGKSGFCRRRGWCGPTLPCL